MRTKSKKEEKWRKFLELIDKLPPNNKMAYLLWKYDDSYDDRVLDLLYAERYINIEDYLKFLQEYRDSIKDDLNRVDYKLEKIKKIDNAESNSYGKWFKVLDLLEWVNEE